VVLPSLHPRRPPSGLVAHHLWWDSPARLLGWVEIARDNMGWRGYFYVEPEPSDRGRWSTNCAHWTRRCTRPEKGARETHL